MVHAALRDLLFRRRRYLISTFGCGLVFAIGLVMTGLSDAFPVEWERTIQALGAKSFVTPAQLSGPFSGASPFEGDRLPAGVDPMAFAVQTATLDEPITVAMLGLVPRSASVPEIESGRGFENAGEAIVSTRSPFGIGDTILVSSHELRVVGTLLLGPLRDGHEFETGDARWYERWANILLIASIAAIGIAPLWLSDALIRSIQPIIQKLQ